MEVTWLADSPQTRSRKRALRACDLCQRKKKRCQHADTQPNSSRMRRRQAGPSPTATRPQPQSRASTTPDAILPARFVGEMNPEAEIRERLAGGTNSTLLRDRVGLWIPASGVESGGDPSRNATDDMSNPAPTYPAAEVYPPHVLDTLIRRRFESARKACRPLPSSTRLPLFGIYFSQVNHILPVVDPRIAISSPFLERAICLVAAKARAAAPHLYLTENAAVVSPRVFCTEVYQGLEDALTEGLERDRVTRIRVLALMALHCENSEGSEIASMHLSQAIHQAQTVGMHLKRPGDADFVHIKLFWSLWTLDKLLASMFGRPALINDHDISIERPCSAMNAPETPTTAFDVWFRISELLSEAILFYRPGTNHEHRAEKPFPSFEEIVGPSGEELGFASLELLELYYQAVAIVFHRTMDNASSESHNFARNQRGLAAIRVQSIVARECSEDLPPLPIVSYAVALSMSVFYRQYRSSNLITHRKRAATDIDACCSLLEGLSVSWYSAEAMARLGRKALQQIHESDPGLYGDELDVHGPAVQSPQATRNKRTRAAPAATGDEESMSMNATYAPVAQNPVVYYTGDHDWAIGDMTDLDLAFDDFLDLSLPTNF
ncbi:fungal specific transcription factor domain-containing protein [Aspergillus fijiensis CBS 313.89]|uniref:Xylanolytic transcriptional activator regulatory domain-containing protein n=1 Tax=Aspergillus fijiensis CBS 313.89 TaxID=1448319 RepID=A0A8G1RXD8_9EURO|nr:uncharacterized protein BO72DRAFT_399220 [Aspergillus fijiensis CBS 313.89]RAK80048.1 hypothetical protein BO72DRAFT_399220 [Aspergillus fijiensis CBS 313.89]